MKLLVALCIGVVSAANKPQIRTVDQSIQIEVPEVVWAGLWHADARKAKQPTLYMKNLASPFLILLPFSCPIGF